MRASRSVQLHISQDEIEKYMFSENELSGGLTVDATLDDDTVMIDAWCVDASKNEEIIIESNRLNVGANDTQTAFMWCVFLGILTYFTNQLIHTEWSWLGN